MEQMEQMEQILPKNPQNTRLKGLSEITVPSVPSVSTPTRAPQTVYGKGGKFFRLFWASCNRAAQRTLLIGRLYNQMKLAQGRPPEDKKGAKFAPFSGSDATSKYIASLHGVSEKTVLTPLSAGAEVRPPTHTSRHPPKTR